MTRVPFSPLDLDIGKTFLDQGKLRAILFSDRTYQVEVSENGESYWTFLQLTGDAQIKDYFCTCQTFEKTRSCPHLGASYLRIFGETKEAWHLRFKRSVWNELCQMEARRHGYEPSCIIKEDPINEELARFVCKTSEGKTSFSLLIYTEEELKRIEEMIFERVVETEESSIKFSNLSQEELTAWRRGRPSHFLRYELSFWSDLAKHLFWLYEEKQISKIAFKGGSLPSIIEATSSSLSMQFVITKPNWPDIIPTLVDLPIPLKVHPFQRIRMKNISYDKQRSCFVLDREKIDPHKEGQILIDLDDWIFVPNDGFYPKEEDPILTKDVIEAEEVPQMLRKYSHLLKKFIPELRIHSIKTKPSYQLFFDQFDRLHIQMYLFEPGDLTSPYSHLFDSWVYLDGVGFYPLEEQRFDKIKTVIEKGGVGGFVSHHRLWLNQYEGFQTHLANIETKVKYHVDLERNLHIQSEMSLEIDSIDIKDFGEWIYIPRQGFYSKSVSKHNFFPTAMMIPMEKVSGFILEKQIELEYIKGFFAVESPIEKSGLEIVCNLQGAIEVIPDYMFSAAYAKKMVIMFEEHSYVDGEGFFLIPPEVRLPKEYRKPVVIVSEQKQYEFLTEELEKLRPYILSLDTKIKKPSFLSLQVSHIRQDHLTGKWCVSLVYKTEFGVFPASLVWKAVRSRKRFLMTKAGLFGLKQPRFDWLKTLPPEKYSNASQQFELTTIEFMRLKIFEDIQIMPSQEETNQRVIAIFRGVYDPSQEEMPNIEGLHSKLRPYQEIGVKWLWHLYQFGLSGLLADDMGLGKTHQAMALLAAVINQDTDRSKKYLVICPTSVIYHWEDLLEKFFPSVKVLVFYGASRTLSKFDQKYQILLTSYGTLRSEKDEIANYQFEIAIFDEMQMAKNRQSQVHKSLKLVKSKMKLGLTGTPVENYLSELKALFDIILPGYFPTDSLFRELFVNPIEKYQDEEKKLLLHQLIKPFVLRRKKTEVLDDLPDKIEEISHVELSDNQLDLYKKIYLKESEFLSHVEQLDNQSFYTHVFALINALKQICDHPALFLKDPNNYQKYESGKFELFKELIQEARRSGQKIVVFTQYLDMMNIIESYLEEENIGYAEIRGSTKDRRQQVMRFKEDPTCEVFVASLQAAGVGIDLVAASVVIHYDRWWNPAKEDQATDRVHRIGQVRGVQVFKMVSKHTIEEHIHRLIERKIDLIQSVIGYDAHEAIQTFDREELIELLRQVHRDIKAIEKNPE